jgi:hypothetical protein
MTKESLAEMLNDRPMGDEISEGEEILAEAAGLVVVFGGSDDLCEMRGAIHDELDCYDGGDTRIKRKKLEMLWCNEPPYSWTYRTTIPHATFDVLEDGKKYCRGIVFSLNELEAKSGELMPKKGKK